jgi:hypothetical protein
MVNRSDLETVSVDSRPRWRGIPIENAAGTGSGGSEVRRRGWDDDNYLCVRADTRGNSENRDERRKTAVHACPFRQNSRRMAWKSSSGLSVSGEQRVSPAGLDSLKK